MRFGDASDLAAPLIRVLLTAGCCFDDGADRRRRRHRRAARGHEAGSDERSLASRPRRAPHPHANNDPAEPPPAEGAYAAKPKIDPIEANGPIFVDWPKPTLAIVISGELDGYLEPCGCAGLENQLGGLKRRHTLIKQLEADGWPLVQARPRRPDQTHAACRPKSSIATPWSRSSKSATHAVGLGANDLKLGNVDALAVRHDEPRRREEPDRLGQRRHLRTRGVGRIWASTRRYRVIEAGGKRIGVTSVLGAKHARPLKNIADIAIADPAEALAQVAPAARRREAATCRCCWCTAIPPKPTELSQQFPQFQIVATAGGADEPPQQPRQDRRQRRRCSSKRGTRACTSSCSAFFDDPDPRSRYRYQRVPLDSRFADSPEMQAKLVAYQQELETMTLAGLGLTRHRRIPTATSPAQPPAPTATRRRGPCSRRRRTTTPPTRW